jgi:proline utilization trans-activator
MDGEHLFSAAIILVMVNIAFPHNARDRAAMDLALEVMKGVAEKGNSHIKSLYRLLLNLSPLTEKDSPEAGEDIAEPVVVPNQNFAPSLVPSSEFLSENDLIAGGYLDLNQSVFQSDEAGFMGGITSDADVRIWAEGYEIFDVNMDFDWTQWTN